MLPDKLLQVLEHEGVVAIVTMGENGPHVVNTWNSYIQLTNDEHFLIPVGAMIQTEANVDKRPDVLMTLGTREVEGIRGPGTGFLINGKAAFLDSGESFEAVRRKFPWIRAVLDVSILSSTQTL